MHLATSGNVACAAQLQHDPICALMHADMANQSHESRSQDFQKQRYVTRTCLLERFMSHKVDIWCRIVAENRSNGDV